MSDDSLLTIAQIAATLMGLLLVGAFFYVETGFQRLRSWGPHAGAFFRAFAKFVLVLYSLVLGLSLGLVVLETVWVAVALGVLSAAVLRGLIDVTLRARALPKVVRKGHGQVWYVWPPALFTLALPWALDGAPPTRSSLTWTLLLGGALAFYLTASLLVFAFDLSSAGSGYDDAHRDGDQDELQSSQAEARL